MNNDNVKSNIFRLRRQSGMSQEEVAEKMGISITSYRKLERGSTILVSTRIQQLSSIFNITEQEILFGKEAENIQDLKNQKLEEEWARKESEEINDLKLKLLQLQGEISTLRGWLSDKEEIIQMQKEALR